MQINKYQLANGLRLIHNYDDSTSMVAVNVLYNVGAKDEDPQRTGFAHLFEHLMFGGSVNIPDYDGPLQNAGGDNNAWTNNDMTNYYLSIPYQNIETGFWLESDRMLSLAFSEKSLEVQRQVVMEEFKQVALNQPYGDVQHLNRALCYTEHPYRWPTLGKELSHIEHATIADVKAFFGKFYTPNNAILSVSGSISFEDCVRLAEKWFGPIPKGQVYKRNLPKEPQQTAARFLEVQRKVPTSAIYKTYPICERMNPDYYVCDMITDILAHGRSSRLFQHLVMDKSIFSEINAYVSGEVEPGSLQIYGKPASGVSLEEADIAIQEELSKLYDSPIGEREIEKVKNKYESSDLFSNISCSSKASNLAIFELLGDAAMIDHEVEKYRSVNANDIKNMASKIFDPSLCSTLYYKHS